MSPIYRMLQSLPSPIPRLTHISFSRMFPYFVREIVEKWARKFFGRWLYEGGQDVPKGAYFSIFAIEFFFTQTSKERLPGSSSDLFLKTPILLVPALFPILATVFMMFVPGLAFVGILYFFRQKLRGKKMIWFLVFCLIPFSMSQAEEKVYTEKEIKNLNRVCFECHSKNETHVLLGNGELLNIDISPKHFYLLDVHALAVPCTGCHKNYTKDFHPQISTFESVKHYRLQRYELCKDCHEKQYQGLTDGVHFKSLQGGNQDAPVCTDCHPVHRMPSFEVAKFQAVTTCGKCHEDVFQEYRKSVHGHALIEDNNVDVPGCMDCHLPHANQDPHKAKERVASPRVCAKCHANEELMSKYGLRADVYETYLNDFHGVTIQFYEDSKKRPPKRIEAVCVDCHGYHGIQKANGEGGAIDRKQVHQMCLKCHENVPENFTAAWLSHYRPSLTKHPFVFLFKLFYWFMIPFTLGGLAIHLVVHFFRYLGHGGSHDE